MNKTSEKHYREQEELEAGFEPLKQRILEIADKMQQIMDLSHFTINHTFRNTYDDENPDIIGDTEAYWQYRQARIRWYLPAATRLVLEDLQNVVVHELCHVLLASMEMNVKAGHEDENELAVENVARAIMGALKNV